MMLLIGVQIGLVKCRTYYYNVRGHKVINNTAVYGDYSNIVSVAIPPSKVAVKLKNGKKKAYVSWSKSKGAVKYKVYRKPSSRAKYKLVKTTSGRTWTNKKLKSKKCYWYKIKAEGKTGRCSSYN